MTFRSWLLAVRAAVRDLLDKGVPLAELHERDVARRMERRKELGLAVTE